VDEDDERAWFGAFAGAGEKGFGCVGVVNRDFVSLLEQMWWRRTKRFGEQAVGVI
jgi:hypothetical protein